MQERGIEGGMGAVIGLSDEQVDEVVDAAREHGEISVANQNAPGQIVLSGVVPALVFALEMSKTVGARKAVRLTVSVASHSPLMRRARDEFGRILAQRPLPRPAGPDARQRPRLVISTADGLRSELTEHLVHGVQWTASVRRMAEPAASPTSSRSARAASSPASSAASAPTSRPTQSTLPTRARVLRALRETPA